MSALRGFLALTLTWLIFAAPASAFDLIDLRGPQQPLGGNPEAAKDKNALCMACHGEQGITMVPMYPSLAGLPETYLYAQMRAFREKGDPQSVMAQILAPLSDQDLRDFAAFYAALPGDGRPAVPQPPVDPQLAAQGEALYLQGDSERGVPPCQGCHGADARGLGEARPGWPRLRGQSQAYLHEKLLKYRDGRDIDSTQDKIMQGVAAHLEESDVNALSAWLASLIPPPPTP